MKGQTGERSFGHDERSKEQSMSYDRWKTRSPDDDLQAPDDPSREQQKADWEDEMQQLGVIGEAAIEPVAWLVTWVMKQSGPQASAYIKEDDARRAASNVEKYAHATNVAVRPAYAHPPRAAAPTLVDAIFDILEAEIYLRIDGTYEYGKAVERIVSLFHEEHTKCRIREGEGYSEPNGLEAMIGRPYGQEKADVTCVMPKSCGWPTCDCGREDAA